MIKYKNGNLLEYIGAALVNTVHSFGVMGKGIALAFKQAFPYYSKVYAKSCKAKKCLQEQS